MKHKHPKELWILSLTELCQRFASWGVGSLLVLYMIEHYQFPNAKATQVYAVFSSVSLFLPLVGGWIADRWNYQSPMLLGALFTGLGCFVLASGIHSLFYLALCLIACGYGIFTPSILTIVGYIYRNHPNLRETGFSIYYTSINSGVFLALVSLGTIANLANWNIAFGVAGIVQIVGLIPLLWYLSQHKETHQQLKAFQKKNQREKRTLTSVDKNRIAVIIIFLLVSLFFWTAFIQGFSSMEIFTHDYMNRMIGSWNVPEGIFLSSQSFFLIILAPILSWLYSWLQRKKMDPSPARKASYSLFFIAACFLVMMIASIEIPAKAASANVSSGYLVFAFFLMAVGEMLLAPIGLSMISRLAPPRYTAVSMGLWYVCIGLGFFNGGMLATMMGKMETLSQFFSIFILITAIPAIAMWFGAKKLTKMSHFNAQRQEGVTHIDW